MSKKDYELIARTIRTARSLSTASGKCYRRELAAEFAAELAATNPRFDRERFIAACMGEDSTDSAGRAVRYSTFGPNDVAR